MQHPILSSRKRLAWFGVCWLLLTGIAWFSIYPELDHTSLLPTLGHLAFHHGVLSILLLGSWFGIRYLRPERQAWTLLVLNHSLYALVITGLAVMLSEWLRPAASADIRALKTLISVLAYCTFVLYLNVQAYYETAIAVRKNEKELFESLKEAELKVLRSQMDPHFIFNSLNSISTLTLIDPDKAHDMILKLSDFLRFSLEIGKTAQVPLSKEWAMCEAYLAIEQIRFGDRLSIDFHQESDVPNLLVPSLLLQTLFENAIKHGIQQSLQPEPIVCRIVRIDQHVQITLRNSLEEGGLRPKGSQTGLENIRVRLQKLYDQPAWITQEATKHTFTIQLFLPI